MAHVAKYQSGALGNMCSHYDRWGGDLTKAAARDNINPTRTHKNYNLAPEREGGQVAFVRERIESLHLSRIRKDAVRMCDCVLTKPQSLDPSKTAEFFGAGYEFLCDRYGADNTISAWVHMDETTPHMHYAWVPVTSDGRLSAKAVVNRYDLQTLHRDMQAYIQRKLSCEVEILLGQEKAQEKALSSVPQKQLDAAKAGLEALEVRKEALSREIALETARLERLRRERNDAEGRISELEQEITVERNRIIEEGYSKEAFEKGTGIGVLESEIREYQRTTRLFDRRRDEVKERIGQLRERIIEVRSRISEVIKGNMNEIPFDYIQKLKHRLELGKLRDIKEKLDREKPRASTQRKGLGR